MGINVPKKAEAAITGNYSISTAYNYGYWDSYESETAMMEKGETESYFKFTVNQGDRLYVKTPYNDSNEGIILELLDNLGKTLRKAESPQNVVGKPNSISWFLPVNCDGTKNGQVFYVRVSRGTKMDIDKNLYFTVGFDNRMRNGRNTFSFSGTASNPGNSGMNMNGVDSNVLSLDLTKNDKIPKGAIVKKITSKATISRRLGGVKHILKPEKADWSPSIIFCTSVTCDGMYDITNTEAAQKWQFKYNCTAGASSKMTDVKITMEWEYDITENNYELFQ